MALINCPECAREISSLAPTCPHCGIPLVRKTHNVKRIIATNGIILLAIALIVFCRGCGRVTASNVGIDALYSSTLGVGVRLGQSKDSVDKLLGAPTQLDTTFEYGNSLHITYANGNVAQIFIAYPNPLWSTMYGLRIGASVDDVVSALGEPHVTADENNSLFYSEGSHTIGFGIEDSKVASIFIFYN